MFGIASAVQADIPDNGVIHGCYGKPGTTYKGNLRVRDFDQGEQCRFYENPLDWNATGPTGPTGATGPTGPTGPAGIGVGGWAVVNSDGTLARGRNTTGSVHIATGAYEVDFNMDVTGCEYGATQGNPGAGNPPRGFIVVAARAGNADGVFVETHDTADVLQDRNFHLSVLC